MALIATIIGLLAVVTALSLLAQRINLPYPTVMVLVGLAISFIPHLPEVQLKPEYIFLIFLPPLLYSAAWQTSWRDFRSNLRPILLLAVGFVLFTTCIVALVMHYVIPQLPWPAAFALGAIISPPDAIAATAITRRLGVPKRIITILEGESLVNDASGLTLYGIATAAAVTGAFSITHDSLKALLTVGGGIALGLALGWIVAWIHRHIDDPLAETVITLLSPFAAFLPAEATGLSGILAVVVMGLYLSHQSSHLFSARLRLRAGVVWDTVAFILNGLVFILIGLQLRYILPQTRGATVAQLAVYIALLTAVIIVARLVWVFPATYIPLWLSHRLRRRDPMPRWQNVFLIAYAGMRGVISLAAALSVPFFTASGQPFPYRNLIIVLTFAIILITLVLQSLTLPPLIRWLKITSSPEGQCEEWEARLQAVQAALHRLDELANQSSIPPNLLARLREHYEERARLLSSARSPDQSCGPPPDIASDIHRLLLDAERDRLLQLYDDEIINEETLRRIEADLDLDELRHTQNR